MAISDTWLKEFEEAMQLADDISGRLREREVIVSSGGDPSHLISSTRRKITILGTCLDRLESLLQNPPEKSRLNEEEVYRRQDMLLGIRFKTKQMAASFSTSPSTRFTPTPGEISTKDTVDPSKAADPPKLAQTTRHHSIVDVAQETSLQTYLLMKESEEPDPPTQGNEDEDSSKGCSMQLSCLITLGILVLLLLIWTIVKIW